MVERLVNAEPSPTKEFAVTIPATLTPPSTLKICPAGTFAPLIKVGPPVSSLLTIEFTLILDISYLPVPVMIDAITFPVVATGSPVNEEPSPEKEFAVTIPVTLTPPKHEKICPEEQVAPILRVGP
tara:strand:- start:1887 stop:2264 length:378 start_codon:yes stop_codon:yes gene_type:complete